jgi:hypothetical protein
MTGLSSYDRLPRPEFRRPSPRRSRGERARGVQSSGTGVAGMIIESHRYPLRCADFNRRELGVASMSEKSVSRRLSIPGPIIEKQIRSPTHLPCERAAVKIVTQPMREEHSSKGF